jgi:hypothetical protein
VPARRPLYPQKQPSNTTAAMSVLCQKRTPALRQIAFCLACFAESEKAPLMSTSGQGQTFGYVRYWSVTLTSGHLAINAFANEPRGSCGRNWRNPCE